MIENPSTNVELSFEQLQQLDVFKKRAANLDAEVFASSKKVQELRLETEAVTREKEYQQGLLDDLTSEVKALEEKKQVLDVAVLTAQSAVEEHAKKADDLRIEIGNHSSSMAGELSRLEEQKALNEKELSDIAKEREQVAADRQEVEAARQVLDSAVKSVSWKSAQA